jgi:4'-phosphopantetheinyl transferase
VNIYWLEQDLADVPAGDEWLSAGEVICLAGMRFAKRRDDWRLGRWTAKRAVAVSCRQALESIEIRAAESGAPEVFFAGIPAPVTISISHRDGRAACAVALSGCSLGCDLETIEPRSEFFAADYFTIEEQAIVTHAPESDRSLLLTLLWSAKESVLKAVREGLRVDIRSVAVTLAVPHCDQAGWHPLTARYADRQEFHGWWRRSENMLRTMVADPPPLPPVAAAFVICSTSI